MQAFLLHSDELDAQMLAQWLTIPSGSQLPSEWAGSVVIHWGAIGEERDVDDSFLHVQRHERADSLQRYGRFILQLAAAIQRAQDKGKSEALLGLHGIKTSSSHISVKEHAFFPYQYKIPVFHLQALAIFEQKKSSQWIPQPGNKLFKQGGYKEIELAGATYHMRRAVRESVKAIYALGLDYGMVTIGVLPSGHTLVLKVDPVPRLNRRLAQLFAQAIERYEAELARELARSERVVLGSDPEFLLLSAQGKVVAASRFLEREGPVGCDAIVLSGHRVILPLAELRPQPSADPRQLARNLHQTMQLAARAITDESLAWLSGGMPLRGFPLGGHIHFSRCWLNGHLLRALDNYLALPLMQIEGESTRQRRPRYGCLGDFRPQPHGGFEYRTLPSWLVSPAVTRGVLALAAVIAEHYWSLPQRPLQETEVQASFYKGNKEKVRGIIEHLWSDLENLPSYERYFKSLEPLKSMIFRMEPWNEMTDIRTAWKIAPYQTEREIPYLNS